MVQFKYRDKKPQFVPVCSRCGVEIEDPMKANLVVFDNRCDGKDDSELLCWGCDEPKGAWIRWVDVLHDLTPKELQPKKNDYNRARYVLEFTSGPCEE